MANASLWILRLLRSRNLVFRRLRTIVAVVWGINFCLFVTLILCNTTDSCGIGSQQLSNSGHKKSPSIKAGRVLFAEPPLKLRTNDGKIDTRLKRNIQHSTSLKRMNGKVLKLTPNPKLQRSLILSKTKNAQKKIGLNVQKPKQVVPKLQKQKYSTINLNQVQLNATHVVVAKGSKLVIQKLLRESQNKQKNIATSKITYPNAPQIRKEGKFNVPRKTSRLYVGVMTTGKFLKTRAKACYNTWGKNPFVSKVDFFARPAKGDRHEFSVVTLPDVDDNAYPPQKKSFRMLQYMCENHLDDFDWFLRADDDVYIKVQEFISYILLPTNSTMGYLGHPGHGRDHDSDAHKLLGTDTYCMGGPGILFSRWALKKLCPHLEECRKTVVIKNEDIELGRCVKKHLGPGCMTPKEMLYRFFHVSQDQLAPVLAGNMNTFRPYDKALTLHPIKDPAAMYRVHEYYLKNRKRLQDILNKKKQH